MPAAEADLLREFRGAPHSPEHLLDGGETVELAGIEFAVTLVPGHSPASVAYAADGHLFVGDVLFAGSVGRTDLDGGDMGTLLRSIATLIDAYPPETIVLPGHGPVTTLRDERDTNPFLGPLRS
jgi:glyoxylase-like metal-dependent hydrolase (beta-lactamase superfamily II)